MGNSSSSVPAVSRPSKQISSDKIRNSIKDMFNVSQNKNITSDATIGFRADSSSLATDFTSSQQGGNTFQSRMNRYDEVLEAINKQNGGSGCGCGNDQYSATSNAQLTALKGGDFESDTSISSLRNKNDEYSATSNANLSALRGGNMDSETSVASLRNKNESDTSNNPVDYSVLKGGEGEESESESQSESETESESESEKKKKKHGTDSESESESETDVDIDDDDESEEFEDDDATMERIMEDDDSDSDDDISTESSSSSDVSSSSSVSPIKKIIGRQSRQKGKKKHGKKSKRYARVESSMRSSDVRAVPFYSSENAQSHLQRLQKRNRF